jgi:hypothetical protein
MDTVSRGGIVCGQQQLLYSSICSQVMFKWGPDLAILLLLVAYDPARLSRTPVSTLYLLITIQPTLHT